MAETLATVTRVVAVALVALVPLINPAGVAPIFLSLTSGATDRARSVLARRIARNSFVVLVVAMLAGSPLLIVFGLSLAEIRIAGGLLVIATAWHLVRTDHTPDSTIVALPPDRSDAVVTHTFYPLTFPVTIGPGSLAVAVTLGAGTRTTDTLDLAAVLGAVIGCALIASTVYVCYRFAARAARILGSAGTVVLLRMSAFILLSVGVKILSDGIVERFTTGSA